MESLSQQNTEKDLPCCPKGSHGKPASQYLEAKGSMETWTLDGKELPTYITGPADAKITILAVHDIFNMNETRVKACCDYLAD